MELTKQSLPVTYCDPEQYTPAITASSGPEPNDRHHLVITTIELQVIVSALRIARRRSFAITEVGDPHPAELDRTHEILAGVYRAIMGR